MRILIHGINFSPELTGIGKYTGEMAQWLAAQGHEVRAVTAPPYYPQWRVAEGFSGWWYRRETVWVSPPLPLSPALSREGRGSSCRGGLVVYRCPLWVPAKPSGLKRVLHLASFALSSFPVIGSQIFWRPDVVLVVEPPFFCAPQAWLVARLSGGKAWLHIQDYEADAAFDLGLLKGAVLRGLVATCECWLMRRFDRVSTISQGMLDRALAKGVAPERVVLFPNWVDMKGLSKIGLNKAGLRTEDLGLEKTGLSKAGVRTEDLGLSKASTSKAGLGGYREELGIAADAVVALYAGNMGGKQGLEILAQVASLLRDERNIVFVFCGSGTGRSDLVALCDGLSNVRLLDLQPVERLGELLGMADIHLLPQRADAADLVMPSKLTGMLASGRPVVATAHADTELANVVSGCGLVVEPEQAQFFADAINRLAQDAALRARLGAAGRAYAVANLDRDGVLARFEAELKKVLRAEDLGL